MEAVHGMVWIFPGIAHYNIHDCTYFIKMHQGCASNSCCRKASLELPGVIGSIQRNAYKVHTVKSVSALFPTRARWHLPPNIFPPATRFYRFRALGSLQFSLEHSLVYYRETYRTLKFFNKNSQIKRGNCMIKQKAGSTCVVYVCSARFCIQY